MDGDEADLAGEGAGGARIAHEDSLATVEVVLGMGEGVVDISAARRLHGGESGDFGRPWAFWVGRSPHVYALREGRTIEGDIALQVVIPRNAGDTPAIEDRDCVGDAR